MRQTVTAFSRPDEAAREIAAREHDLRTWRESHPDDDVPVRLDGEETARAFAQQDKGWATLYGIVNAGAAGCVLDRAGNVLLASRSIPELLGAWRDAESPQAGWSTGPGSGRLALSLTPGSGYRWLDEVSAEPNWKPDPDSPRRPHPRRDHLGNAHKLATVAGSAPTPRIRAIQYLGDKAGREAATMLHREGATVVRTILCWELGPWVRPAAGGVSRGVEVIDAMPASGAVVNVDGVAVMGGDMAGSLMEVPEWLLVALSGKQGWR